MSASDPNNFSVTIHDSITKVPAAEWDGIVGRDKIRCKHCFLLAVERSNIAGMKLFYPVVYDAHGRIVAHTIVYLVRSELNIFATGINRKISDAIRKVWKNYLFFRTMECGSPVALGDCFSVAKNFDRGALLTCLIRAIEASAEEKKVSAVVFRDFYQEELESYQRLLGKGYSRLDHLPIALMNLPWSKFDDYKKSLRSHYRYNLNKVQARLNRDNITVEITRNFAAHAEVFQSLWDNVYRNANEFRREYLDIAFFENMGKNEGFDCRALILKKDQEIIGFSLLLLDDETLTTMYVGIDYKHNKRYSVYYNILYLTIDLAIKENKKIIDMGITCYTPKAQIGCQFAPLSIFVKHLRPIINIFCGPALRIMNPCVTIFEKRVYNSIEGGRR